MRLGGLWWGVLSILAEEDFEEFGLGVLVEITKAGWVGIELEVGVSVNSWGDWDWGPVESDDEDEYGWCGMIGVEV